MEILILSAVVIFIMIGGLRPAKQLTKMAEQQINLYEDKHKALLIKDYKSIGEDITEEDYNKAQEARERIRKFSF